MGVEMAFIPVPNGIQLCFTFSTASEPWQFCLTLRKSAGAPEDTDLAQATADGSAWWTSNLRNLISTAATLVEIIATDLTSQGAPQNRVTVNQTGLESGTPLPSNAALVVSHRTAKRGRSYRGRSYLSGRGIGGSNGANEVAAAIASGVGAAFAALRTLLDGHGFDHVVASKQHNGVATSPAETNEVINYVVDTKYDSQRRRLAGRGA
jgi:hypothetical protein